MELSTVIGMVKGLKSQQHKETLVGPMDILALSSDTDTLYK